jgi:hypothetical protein
MYKEKQTNPNMLGLASCLLYTSFKYRESAVGTRGRKHSLMKASSAIANGSRKPRDGQ